MKRIRAHLEGLLSSEQFTYPALRSMLLTLILDQFCIYIMGVLSTALVSSVGEAAIAAVSMVNTINGLIALLFTALVWLMVDVLRWNDLVAKLLSNFVVIIINYIASKFWIFRDKG